MKFLSKIITSVLKEDKLIDKINKMNDYNIYSFFGSPNKVDKPSYIKASNILVDESNSNLNNNSIVKLIDWGLSEYVPKDNMQTKIQSKIIQNMNK